MVERLGGQLRVNSKIGEGSRFSCLLPFTIATSFNGPPEKKSTSTDEAGSGASGTSEIDSLVEALSSSHMAPHKLGVQARTRNPIARKALPPTGGKFEIEDSAYPVRGIKVDGFDLDSGGSVAVTQPSAQRPTRQAESKSMHFPGQVALRVLVVEVLHFIRRVLSL